jgi:purine-binding chemotaxis protein CheW
MVAASSSPFSFLERPSAADKYLTFLLGSESYGVQVLRVREIIRMLDITPVPHMPEFIRGVVNLRGKVIPVIDLRIKFQLSAHEIGARTCIVIVIINFSDKSKTLAGLIVDQAEEVCVIPSKDIEPAPNFGDKISTSYILGIAKLKGKVKTLLDIDKVIAANTFLELPLPELEPERPPS